MADTNTNKPRIVVSLGKEIFEKLELESIKKSLTKSVIIQLALEKYFEEKEGKSS